MGLYCIMVKLADNNNKELTNVSTTFIWKLRIMTVLSTLEFSVRHCGIFSEVISWELKNLQL